MRELNSRIMDYKIHIGKRAFQERQKYIPQAPL